MRPEDRERILTEAKARIVKAHTRNALGRGAALDEVLADTVYFERQRLKDDPSPRRAKDLEFIKGIQKQLGRVGETQLQDLLGQAATRYAEEICGNFDERVYNIVTRVIPPTLGLMLNAVSPKRLLKRLPEFPSLDNAVIINGETEHLRRLHEHGTVIFTPTHVSNMDSLILGSAFYRLGLPPVIYGAGLNLFSNPLIGYFMHNLGAYTVDRRKKDPLYKEVLKEYATLTLESGYNNLFFPGGTRARAGAIERHLKLGLLGTNIRAYVNNLKRNAAQPKMFIVPVTLSFQLVLEGETLIDDFLKEVGKSRYIITDDEFSKPKRIFDFVSQMMGLDSKIYVTLSRGFDPFGNPVDDDGESLDPNGRIVDTARYTYVDGAPEECVQRDMEYTKELGERIAESFMKNNLLQSTHVVAFAMLSLLRLANPQTDIVRLLRIGGRVNDLDMREVFREVGRLLGVLRAMAADGKIRLADMLQDSAFEADEVVANALRHFSIYHKNPAITRKGDRLFATDRHLLFYYHNRLEGYDLAAPLGLKPVLRRNHRGLRGAA